NAYTSSSSGSPSAPSCLCGGNDDQPPGALKVSPTMRWRAGTCATATSCTSRSHDSRPRTCTVTSDGSTNTTSPGSTSPKRVVATTSSEMSVASTVNVVPAGRYAACARPRNGEVRCARSSFHTTSPCTSTTTHSSAVGASTVYVAPG